MIGGATLKPGKYGLLTIPGKKEWIVIISKDTTVNQASTYKIENDVVRATIVPSKLKEANEMFTMQFANIKFESCELQLMWGNLGINLPIATNVRDRIRMQAEQALAADKVTANTYYAAANFYFDLDKDLNKALSSISKAIEASPTSFWMHLLKAKIERDLGDKVAAKASAEKCIAVATEQKNTDYVRMANELIKKL
jgi:tetratricopeptide (TPR) repeat protein